MKLSRITLAALAATFAVVVSACGGGGDVPTGAVAVVDGTEISRTELDQLVERAKKAYEAQKQEFPKVGTPEYQNVQTQYVAFLVQREEFEKEADDLEVEITDKDVDKALDEFVKSRFQGDRKQFGKALEGQGFTEEEFRETIRTGVLSQKLFDAVTKDVQATDAEIVAYYTQNSAQYVTKESRDVRHILISEKSDGDKVDFAKSKAEADRIYAELKNGADFAALAKQVSDDPGSKETGGKLTITRGQTVPEFDKTSFELEQGVVSPPVKTTYGYHVIEALSPVRKAETTSIAKVRASIKATLLQEKRTNTMTEWVENLTKDYEGKITYAAGFEPPDVPPASTEAETE
ncbi:MAG: peptidylprolyl isomerase [Actinobacteria bacterium]|nr:peptidylprolyl isomerase [Actinomycetota bacterium]